MSETGPHRHFRSLFRQSAPGSRINEDSCGLHAGLGWIIDGATGVSGGKSTPGASDAAWLAGAIDTALGALAGAHTSTSLLLQRLEAEIEAAFRDLHTQPTTSFKDLGPAACLGLVAVRPDANGLRLDGAFLGDVVALVPTREGVVRWTDERAKPFERRTLAALDASDRPESGGMPEAVRLQILENRQQLNRTDGYWVVQPERPWAGRELTLRHDDRAWSAHRACH